MDKRFMLSQSFILIGFVVILFTYAVIIRCNLSLSKFIPSLAYAKILLQ